MTEPHYYSRLGCIASTQGGNLPHWSQQCATFVTFRLGDSLPEGKLSQLQAEREEWMKAHPRFHCRRYVPSRQTAVHGVASDSTAAGRRVYVDAASCRVNEGGDEQTPPQEVARSTAYGTRRDAAFTLPRLRRSVGSSRQNGILSIMNEPHYYSRLGCVASTQGGNLPHWSQQCATFVTFRLGDSLPEGKLAQLQVEREEWMKAHPRFHCRRDVPSRQEAVHGVASDSDAARCRVYVDATSRRVKMVYFPP